MTARSVPEWIGATPDTPVPARVKLRVFERHGGRCHISGRVIRPGEPWELEHIIAMVNWTGEGHGNRESNFAPALKDKHREKTKEDVAIKATAARKRKKLFGITKRKGRPVPGSKDSPWKRQWNKHDQRWETVPR